MLKRSFYLIMIVVASQLSLQGQFEIKTNVLGLVTNNYNGQVELLLGDRSGMELEASFRETPWFTALSGSEIKNNAFRTMVSYKYYIVGEDPTAGLYFGPYIKLKVAGLDNVPTVLDENYPGPTSDNPETAAVFNTAFFLGANGGQKIVLNNNFVIEYYGGFGYALFNERRIREEISDELRSYLDIERNSFTWPLDFRLGFTLGYRFWR
ncbi:DUF3575 domain-containing protein [Portibacter marinus]|uniref:DUF3575 domain-containing protein n=1 Tax=Portibacter marinus TaxID=2898660 RepID=UPI001F1D099B|nr:DUF3575 domain-containing protein [Portibacter marinus]